MISFQVNLIKMLQVRSFIAHTSTLFKKMHEETLYNLLVILCRYDLSFKEVQAFQDKDPDDKTVLAE